METIYKLFFILFSGESIGDKKLDSCVVSVYPSLNPDHETMSIPDKVLTQLEISAKISKDGATLSGSDLLYNYEEVSLIS